VDDDAITALVTRLSRPHTSGGVVIERAAILAAGADFPAVMDWIVTHSGTPETSVTANRSRGLHGSRINDGDVTASRNPLRFVLPAEALHAPPPSQHTHQPGSTPGAGQPADASRGPKP
jgi:hypothetical protein